MRNAALPVTLIVIGALGLIWYYGWFPDFDAITSIGFIAGGILVLVMDRVTKSSIVLGPTLIAIGLAWWAHDQHHVRFSLLVPLLLILIGVLMLVARSPRIPERRPPRETNGTN
jgi:hypothetical protein